MKYKLLLAAGMFAFLYYACNGPKKAAGVTPYQELIAGTGVKKPVKNKEMYAATTETVALDSAYIEGGNLHLFTAKIQACDADNFNLVWNGATTKSLPPQASVKLLLLTDPVCKEQHRFHLAYQLKSLQPRPDSALAGTIMLRVAGLKPLLKYVY